MMLISKSSSVNIQTRLKRSPPKARQAKAGGSLQNARPFLFIKKSFPFLREGFSFEKNILNVLRFSNRAYVHKTFLICFFPEHNGSVNQSEKCMIFSDADIVARIMFCTTLTNDDVAGDYFLPAVNFYSKSFAMRLPTVS
jgi:hypothetical protein